MACTRVCYTVMGDTQETIVNDIHSHAHAGVDLKVTRGRETLSSIGKATGSIFILKPYSRKLASCPQMGDVHCIPYSWICPLVIL